MASSFGDLPPVLTVPEAALLARIGKGAMYELVHSEGFPAIWIGRFVRVQTEPFIKWLEKGGCIDSNR